MDEWHQQMLVMFLAENWALFERFCEQYDEDPDDIYHELGGEDE